MAGAGYAFIWVEMQHEAISREQVARRWRTCPGPAAPGVRVAYADEREIQHSARQNSWCSDSYAYTAFVSPQWTDKSA